ncbi:Killer cell immunoglobulin-like receptor 2DL4 [Gossypium arboreum]|uniref:Killer cell immunoglobulin-like receptor 2DL4 n=1 Tax=Gossypium arboreum TaxID=29729 RepID=A0A0B0NXU1_GOSAR|nr:Killer cell immunoglobulin-like receptor 2DL4 [Gossypium arboreum]
MYIYVAYQIILPLLPCHLGTIIASLIIIPVEHSKYYKCHINIHSQSYLISCNAHHGGTHGLTHISYQSRCYYTGCSQKLSGIQPLKDYLATSRTHKTIGRTSITCIVSIMNLDHSTGLEATYITNLDHSTSSDFLIPSDMSLVS